MSPTARDEEYQQNADIIRVGGVEQTVKSSKRFCAGFIYRPDIRHVPEDRCDLALMLWILLHKFDEAAECVLVFGRISGAAQHGRREMRGDGFILFFVFFPSTLGQLSSVKNPVL